jgi:hypothetical protein
LPVVPSRAGHESPCPAGPWAKHLLDNDGTHETQIEIADLDRDGHLDVVLSGEETDHGLAWYHNPGEKSSGPRPRHRLLSGWKGLHSLELADFDKDGDLDIVGKNFEGDTRPRLWLNPGQRQLSLSQ